MSGNVEWVVLIFIGTVAIGCFVIAWRARTMLTQYELKYDMALAELSRDIQDRNFLAKYDLAIADLIKDVRHTKRNLALHSEIFSKMNDDLIRAQAEIARVGKIVNGSHR